MAVGEVFSVEQQRRLDEATAAASLQTGLHFAAYVGDPVAAANVPGHDPEAAGNSLLAQVAGRHGEAVLLLVDPGRRDAAVLTTAGARLRLSDQACRLAMISMTTSFGLGDLAGGLVIGLRMLADSTEPPLPEFHRPPAVASTTTRGVGPTGPQAR